MNVTTTLVVENPFGESLINNLVVIYFVAVGLLTVGIGLLFMFSFRRCWVCVWLKVKCLLCCYRRSNEQELQNSTLELTEIFSDLE